MLRSLYTAISGLRAHQTWMDVIANNLANVNTTAFKGASVSFQDLISQAMRGATGPNVPLDNINPMQVGLGVAIAGINILQAQGNLQQTGKSTDAAIQGDGFFVVGNGAHNFYTRDGGFDVGVDSMLMVPSTGMRVQGWVANAAGVVDTTLPIGSIPIPVGQKMAAVATTKSVERGNLQADAAIGASFTSTALVVDSLGIKHNIRVTYTKEANNNWSWSATPDPTDLSIASVTQVPVAGPGNLLFDVNGRYNPASPAATFNVTYTNGANGPQPVTLDFSNMTQLGGQPSEVNSFADGFAAGQLISFAVGESGAISGIYSNGLSRTIGQLAIATFVTPTGLLRAGANLFDLTPASGLPLIGTAQTGSRGKVSAGMLEMSNVDLAGQFTQMIQSQRGFQANSRVITTSDEMLQEAIAMKR